VSAYKLGGGAIVDIAPEGTADLRWRTLDGRTGRLVSSPDGKWTSLYGWTNDIDHIPVSFGPCGSGEIRFKGAKGKAIAFDVQETRFTSHGVTLVGRLVLPKGAGAVPVMVAGHGSEKTSGLINGFRQRLYPAAGAGVFVFDKRGTGQSGGKYTQDFDLLADDLVAAMLEARRLAGSRGNRFGFQGGSQAGWILPLAAARTPVDYVIIGYGVAASPLIEDRTETFQDLTAAGWGPDVLQKAREVTDATAGVVASHFKDGYGPLNAAVAKYRGEPWFKDLKGEFTGEVVKHSEAELRFGGPAQDQGTTWNVDAVGNLSRVPAPLLWMFAGDDTQGAGPETIENLMLLKAQGRPITLAVFGKTEHGIHYYRLGKNGERQETRYAPDYFKMELDFARRGRVGLIHPSAEVLSPSGLFGRIPGS
jgi:dienelactone hydrolase